MSTRILIGAPPAQQATERTGGHYWTRDDETVLANGWVEAWPMRQLVDQLRVSEQVVVRQLMTVGLATDTLEVVGRLGCVPGGLLEMRHRLMRDRLSYTLSCLVITRAGEVVHVSIHPDRAAAEQTRDQALAAEAMAEDSTVEWTIADRWPGGLNAGLDIRNT